MYAFERIGNGHGVYQTSLANVQNHVDAGWCIFLASQVTFVPTIPLLMKAWGHMQLLC